MIPDKLFQVTVNPTHPVKQAYLSNVIQAIRDKNPETKSFRLYFVVPKDIYARYSAQRYVNKDDSAAQNSTAEIKMIKQWALEVDLDAMRKADRPS
jgi:hypothetical protein